MGTTRARFSVGGLLLRSDERAAGAGPTAEAEQRQPPSGVISPRY